jgi:hypothetical protein
LEIDDRDHAVVWGQQPFFAPLRPTTFGRHGSLLLGVINKRYGDRGV